MAIAHAFDLLRWQKVYFNGGVGWQDKAVDVVANLRRESEQQKNYMGLWRWSSLLETKIGGNEEIEQANSSSSDGGVVHFGGKRS